MYNPKNILTGQLNKPSRITPEKAAELYCELGLIMPQEHFLSYLKYSKKRKSITYDEIYLIDSLYAANGIPTICSFKSNNVFLGESYADIVSKHKTLYGNNEPVTVSDLLDTPDTFIEKYANSFRTTRQSTESSPLALYCEGCAESSSLPTFTVSENNSFGLYDKRIRDRISILDKSSIFALLPTSDMTREEYEGEAIKAMSLLENSGVIYNPFIIGERGLLVDVLKFTQGAVINTATYPQNPTCQTFAKTLAALSGYAAFFITARNKEQLSSSLSSSKLTPIECAKTNNEGLITFYSGKKFIFELDTGHLQNINSRKPVDIIADTHNAGEKTSQLSSVKGCDSIVKHCQNGAYESATDIISYASCDINENAVSNGIFTALLPIFELAAKGIDRKNITISKKIEIGGDHVNSNDVSTLISLARAQIDLTVHGESNAINYKTKQNTLHVFARGNRTLANAPADSFSHNGSGIYILSPMKKDEEIPDFANIRKLLDYLYAIIRKGSVLSAKVFCDTPINDAIASMENGKFKAKTRSIEGILCPPLYVIVEANEGIGGTHIGEVYEQDASEPDFIPTPYFEKPYEKAQNPNVLIADFNSKETKLKTVAKSFYHRGARVKYVKATLEQKCLEYLTGALSDTHIIIFCGDDELIADALCDINFQEAMTKYKEGRKLIIAYGSGAISALSDLHYLPAIYSQAVTLDHDSSKIELYSKNIPSAFSSKKITYKAKLLGSNKLISGDCVNALICANDNGKIYSDGLISNDGAAIGIYSLMCDEIIESAIKYYI